MIETQPEGEGVAPHESKDTPPTPPAPAASRRARTPPAVAVAVRDTKVIGRSVQSVVKNILRSSSRGPCFREVREVTQCDQWYVNTHSGPLRAFRSFEDPQDEEHTVRLIDVEGVVHGTGQVRNSQGQCMVHLDDGLFVAKCSDEGERYLSEAVCFNHTFASVYYGALHKHRHLQPDDAEVVGSIAVGKTVEGVLSCCSLGGTLRLKLKDGSWTSMSSQTGTQLLKEVAPMDKWLVNVRSEIRLQVHDDIDARGRWVRDIPLGESVHGNGLVVNRFGSQRMLLDDGMWVTYCNADGMQYFLPSGSFEHWGEAV